MDLEIFARKASSSAYLSAFFFLRFFSRRLFIVVLTILKVEVSANSPS